MNNQPNPASGTKNKSAAVKKVSKLLTLASDHAATKGEADSALSKARQIARANGIRVEGLLPQGAQSLGGRQQQEIQEILNSRFPFGKHQGRGVGEILQQEPDYVQGVIQACAEFHPEFCVGLRRLLDHVRGHHG